MNEPQARYRIGIDVGGTFTDLVAVDRNGTTTLAKTPSTPADQSVGVLDGLGRLAAGLDTDLADLLSRTERIVHGATVATNAILERKGAKVGLLTTEGHRDVIEMREGLKPDRYNMSLPPPEPLVPRRRRLGVAERLRPDGTVERPLDKASLDAAVARLKEQGVGSVAVCFLHAWRDGAHERAAGEAVRAAMPDAYISLSSEVLPQIKEFERVSTTVVNAYVGPALELYLGNLVRRLEEAGYAGQLLVILSHGGVAPVGEAVRLAAGTVLSGPAGGVSGARYAAELLGMRDLIPFDMGGTSTDISLISEGRAALSSDRGIAGERIALSSLDIATIGAGGGSIAHVDAGGVLHVGPRSAGADPGPACYGRGGADATVTDASLVLGFLDPGNFLGGRESLDAEAAEAALGRLAGTLGVDGVRAAEGVHRVVHTNMAEAIRLVSVRRGVDPRRFALLSFGGAAGIHITDVARQLDIARVIAPRVASVLSAWGMLATDLRFEAVRTHIGDAARLDADALRNVYRRLEDGARNRLARSHDGEVLVGRAADMRYGEQIFEIDVDLDGIDWEADDLMDRIAERFHARHEALFTYALRDDDVVLVNARAAAVGRLPDLPREPMPAAAAEAGPRTRRRIFVGEWCEAPVYDFGALAPGQVLEGPAVAESDLTTIVLRPGDRAAATAMGWLDIAVG